jgi:hypothetical protein
MAVLQRDTIPDKLRAAKESAVAQYLSTTTPKGLMAFAAHADPDVNVVGVGVGRRVVDGKRTAEQGVRFYVKNKLAKRAIPKDDLLPKSINGVPTDVVESGEFRMFGSPTPEQSYMRPAKPGCSVGFAFSGAKAGYVMAGTFGAVVAVGTDWYILSNNHVLANQNQLPLGSPIYQPGLLDKNTPGPDAIAKLTKFVKLSATTPNKVDCAIAKIDKNSLVSPVIMPQVNKLKSGAPIAAADTMKVMKTGRTTGYTTGSVHDVSATVKVTYDIGVLTFADQVIIYGDGDAFSDAGDSGSLIVDRKTGRATALLFGGSKAYTIGNHIADVLNAFKASIVTG